MILDDLFELRTTLPLSKGVMDVARDNYAALIATMHPEDFLALTTTGEEELSHIRNAEFAPDLDAFKAGSDHRFRPDAYYMPFLRVVLATGKVIGHEGRHRAAMVQRSGGTSFPVSIIFYTDTVYRLSWYEYDTETHEDVSREQVLSDVDNAQARKNELEQQDDIGGVRMEQGGLSKLRGPPSRSQGSFTPAPWLPSDMPTQLTGQFVSSVRVPTSRMKIGVVKGYRR